MNEHDTIWKYPFVGSNGLFPWSLTPKRLKLILKDKLAEVADEKRIGTPIGTAIDGWGTPNGTDPGMVITTTPGTGYITIANPNIVSFSGSHNPSTSTQANWYPTGSNVTYTANGGPTWYTVNKIENDSREK